MRFLVVALLALLLAGDAIAADGAYPNATCATSDAVQIVPTIGPGKVVSYCPVSTTTQIIRVSNVADCNWNGDTTGTGAGTATLSVKQCSGSASAANDCKTPLFSGVAVTSNTENAHFSLPSGVYLITASVAEANGRLVCTGRN